MDLPQARRPVSFLANRSTALLHRAIVEQLHPHLAISTYDTDYVLVQKEFAGATLQALDKYGHQLIEDDDESRRNSIE